MTAIRNHFLPRGRRLGGADRRGDGGETVSDGETRLDGTPVPGCTQGGFVAASDQSEEQLQDSNIKMFDPDVVLEALGVVCNATVTSVRKQSSEARSYSGFQVASLAIQNLFFSDSAAPTRLFLNQFISAVVDGDQTCPVARSTFFGIHDMSGAGLRKSTVASRSSRHILIDEDEFFDPTYDYDFTGLKDTKTYYRGGEEYKRPCGWKRFALKVVDKYDGNEWLGTTDRSTESVPGEWPVSYHGTSYEGAEGITKDCYKAGHRNVYGTGVYSTPDIEEAENNYCKEFTATKNGKRYKVILQNRINPKYRKICKRKNYWLVEIDDKLPDEEKKKKAEQAIRPYGLLLKKL